MDFLAQSNVLSRFQSLQTLLCENAGVLECWSVVLMVTEI